MDKKHYNHPSRFPTFIKDGMHTCFVGRCNSYNLSSQYETFSFKIKYGKF